MTFKYEGIGIFCFLCGLLGYSGQLRDQRILLEQDGGRRKGSTELRVEARRPGLGGGNCWLREQGREMLDENCTDNQISKRDSRDRPVGDNIVNAGGVGEVNAHSS